MTFEGHIVYLWPEQHHLRPSGARVQMIDYHYYQYTRPNRTNSFNEKKKFNRAVA